MFMKQALVVFAALFFVVISSAAVDKTGDKHCRPHCKHPKKTVAAEWKTWTTLFASEATRDESTHFFNDNAQLWVLSEGFAPSGCCQARVNHLFICDSVGSALVAALDPVFTELKNGTVIADFTLILTTVNVASRAYHFKQWWNPDRKCHYKIAYGILQSYACPFTDYPNCFGKGFTKL